MKSPNSFFSAVAAKIPARHIVAGPVSGTDTSVLPRACHGLIRARNPSDVRHVLKCAQRFSVALHPVSTGLNLGYGDGFPANRKSVILDLRSLNRILQFDRREGWMRIEPGVTQAAVVRALEKRASPFAFDITYSLQETSVVGNALERGRTLFGAREYDLIGAKLALSNGEILTTGFDPTAKSPLSAGLNLHPLIFQSNLGVVLEGIVRLHRQDPRMKYYLIGCRKFSDLGLAVNGGPWRPLRWFCRESFAHAPVAFPQSESRAGVLVVESLCSRPQIQRLLGTGFVVRSVSRHKLMIAPENFSTPALAYFSFSSRSSAPALLEAHRLRGAMERRHGIAISETISFLNNAAVFLWRTGPGNLQELADAIEAHGYQLYRRHSGLRARGASTWQRKIKTCFDPDRLIAPERYGL